jgi:hypothetical protein
MQFHTGLVIKPEIQKLIENIDGLDGIISFLSHKKFSVNEDGCSLQQITNINAMDDFQANNLNCNEIILNCDSEEDAENYLSIIKAGLYLAKPMKLSAQGLDYTVQVREGDEYYLNTQEIWEQFICEDSLDIALFTLSKALDNKTYVYSLEKYKISMDLGHINAYSCHPNYGQVFDNITSNHEEHTKMLISIVTAYSIVEELGVELRGSHKQKRFLSTKPYKWNPEIWDDTLERLKKSNINIDYKVQWTIRGEDTEIHKKLDYEYFGEPYNNTNEIKDRKLHFIEAIQFSAYLRNFVAAHKFRELASQISPYDVHNVQMTSRALLMQSMGIWDYVKITNELKANK